MDAQSFGIVEFLVLGRLGKGKPEGGQMNTKLCQYNGGDNIQKHIVTHPVQMMYGGARETSLFETIWRGRWIILLCTALGLGGSYFVFRELPQKYQSRSRILIEKPGDRFGMDIRWQPVGTTSNNYLQTQASMITSSAILNAAMNDPELLAISSLDADDRLAKVLGTLSVSVGKNSDIVSIAALSANPEDAAVLVNALVNAYIQWHKVNRQLTTADLLKDLNAQLENRILDLQTKRKEKMMFEQRHPEVVETARDGIVSTIFDLLKEQLAAARMDAMQKVSYKNRLEVLQSDSAKFRWYIYSQQGFTEVGSEDRKRNRLEAEQYMLQSQLDKVEQGIGIASYSEIEWLQKKKTKITEQLAGFEKTFVTNYVELAKAVAEDALEREKQLTEMYGKEFKKISGLSGADSEYAFLISECQMIQNLCDSLFGQINRLNPESPSEGLKIHILDPAVAAIKPSWPDIKKVMGIGLVLGLMGGGGLAFIRDLRDHRVRSADEITAILGVPVLGAIPKLPWRSVVRRGQRFRIACDSLEAEAFRSLRTALFFGFLPDQVKTVLVTSPGALEGKSTLVSNLGIAMAHVDRKILIIDGDLRKPMQHRIFSMKKYGKGLSDVLNGTANLDEAIKATKIPGLDILVGGQSYASLLESQGLPFEMMLEQLRSRYDCILIDSPPVGIVTDAQILGAYCDSTLLVLRAGRSTREMAQRARDALFTVRARLIGAVVNGVSKRNGRYSHYTGAGYGYNPGGYHFNAMKELPARQVGEPVANGDTAPEIENSTE